MHHPGQALNRWRHIAAAPSSTVRAAFTSSSAYHHLSSVAWTHWHPQSYQNGLDPASTDPPRGRTPAPLPPLHQKPGPGEGGAGTPASRRLVARARARAPSLRAVVGLLLLLSAVLLLARARRAGAGGPSPARAAASSAAHRPAAAGGAAPSPLAMLLLEEGAPAAYSLLRTVPPLPFSPLVWGPLVMGRSASAAPLRPKVAMAPVPTAAGGRGAGEVSRRRGGQQAQGRSAGAGQQGRVSRGGSAGVAGGAAGEEGARRGGGRSSCCWWAGGGRLPCGCQRSAPVQLGAAGSRAAAERGRETAAQAAPRRALRCCLAPALAML